MLVYTIITLYALGFLTLRGGDLLEENGYVTTVPEWRELGHVRGGGLSPHPLAVVREDEREAERKTHAKERVEDLSIWDTPIPMWCGTFQQQCGCTTD